MKAFNEITSEFVQKHGGLIIKYLGDAGLCIFPPKIASQAICAMTGIKTDIDQWLDQNMPGSRLAVNCHFGSVTVGLVPGFRGAPKLM